MGRMRSEGMADAVDEGLISRNTALGDHLRYNHYPPLPLALVTVAEEAIDFANDEDWEEEIVMPSGIQFRGSDTATVGHIVESLHLDSFLTLDTVLERLDA